MKIKIKGREKRGVNNNDNKEIIQKNKRNIKNLL